MLLFRFLRFGVCVTNPPYPLPRPTNLVCQKFYNPDPVLEHLVKGLYGLPKPNQTFKLVVLLDLIQKSTTLTYHIAVAMNGSQSFIQCFHRLEFR